MIDVLQALNDNLQKLKTAIRKRYDVSVERANAEYVYRSTLGAEMAEAKANGMAATSLYDYCRGLQHVANLREKRDILISQEEYLTQMIFYYKTEIRIAEGMAAAERSGI